MSREERMGRKIGKALARGCLLSLIGMMGAVLFIIMILIRVFS